MHDFLVRPKKLKRPHAIDDPTFRCGLRHHGEPTGGHEQLVQLLARQERQVPDQVFDRDQQVHQPWRNLNRWILPVAVFGSSGTKVIQRGYLYGAILSLTNTFSSSSRAGE